MKKTAGEKLYGFPDHHKPSLTDATYQELKDRILAGRIPPGKRLVVNDLVAEWKISNTPIKEALNRLLTEGLVVFEPRRGMSVRRPLTAKEVREKYELRAVLELHCCRVAVAAIEGQPAVMAEMEGLIGEMERMLHDPRHYVDLYRMDARFHKCIVRLCGNEELMQAYEQLSTALATFGIVTSQPHPLRRQEVTLREHKDILDALKKGDGEALYAAMYNHLEEAMRSLLDFYAYSKGRS